MVSISSMLASSQDVTLPYFPELYDADFLDTLLPSTQKSTTAPAASAPNSFIDALKAASHHTYTTNFAKAYNSTESPVLDAFHKLTPYASSREIRDVLAKAWAEDPQLTLRIIWNSRSIHDGKGEKELFYRAFGWLYRNHPRTAIHNLPALIARSEQNEGASHGYWKDLLNILALVALDDIGTLNAKEPLNFLHNFQTEQDAAWMKNMYRTELNKLGSTATPSGRKACSISITSLVQQAAKERRVQKDAQLHGLLLRKLEGATFRALYVAVARLFTEQIMKDLAVLKESEAISDVKERKTHLRQLTFVSKWAPNPRGSHDRVTNISSAIALLLHHHGAMTGLSLPVDHSSATLSLRDTHIIRSFYTRWNIRPLRDAVVIPEVLMAAGKWSQIPYSRVPSICMKNNTERFFVHDTDRFTKYMEDVESGKKTISGATLMPHEILQLIMREYKNLSSPSRAKSGSATALADIRRKLAGQKIQVLEAQWQTMIRRLRESGALDNALAVCDVSGSMGSVYHSLSGKGRIQPIVPALALSLVTAQLAKPPFANGFITFSAMPQFVVLEPQRSLGEAVIKMVESDWSMNTNFDSVFLDLLLPIAVENKVLQEDMVKRLFVFSDMQFDEARDGQGYYHMEQEPIQKSTEWETNHDVIERAFKQAGYEMPQIVYWNLADTFMTTPVTAEKKGVALLNSFSPAMMKVFMGEEDESMLEGEDNWEDIGDREEKQADDFTPLNVMKKALGKKSYEGLIVVD